MSRDKKPDAFSVECQHLFFNNRPVVVIGMPRSGTTYLSHILSLFADLYVFDDLYYLRELDANHVDSLMSDLQLKNLNNFFSWQIKARVKHEANFEKPSITSEQVDQMESIINNIFEGKNPPWALPMKEWLVRLSILRGAVNWGWKAPQDYMYLQKITESFPNAKFIHMMRDPRSVLASYKYLSGQDGSRLQYHPVIYAVYWRNSCRTINAFFSSNKGFEHFKLRFEDLTQNLDRMLKDIALFLELDAPTHIPAWRANSSFQEKKEKSALNGLETLICQYVCALEMRKNGYDLHKVSLRLPDLIFIWLISIRFLLYQFRRLLLNKTARVAVRRLFMSLTK